MTAPVPRAAAQTTISIPDLRDAARSAQELSALLGRILAVAPTVEDIAAARAIAWEVLNDLEVSA